MDPDDSDSDLGVIGPPARIFERQSANDDRIAGDELYQLRARLEALPARFDELVPKIKKLRGGMKIVKSAFKNLSEGHAAIIDMEQDVLERANCIRSFPITVIDEFAVSNWEDLLTGLVYTPIDARAESILRSLENAIDLKCGMAVSQERRRYGELGVKAEQEYEKLRGSTWPSSETDMCKMIVNDDNGTEATINEQTEVVRTWICETAKSWIDVKSIAAAELLCLRRSSGVHTLSLEQVEDWRQKSPEDRQQALLVMVNDALTTSRRTVPGAAASYEKWRNLLRWTAVLGIEAVREKLNKLAEGYERLVNSGGKQFPDLTLGS